ncbi:hypothetical protein COCCADRAFT_42101 [Bipolaris zeicola 26-R-13]|uniref:DUF7587 domain-containing protein n=1 Tax=Cochliobolus carbonum (strain 26-R-13) TaxID=930089 RepID=W6Y6U7_COCC2|nr:uncharacterized protein COCCADRAFT_42101 [Bipolaris zeicola 26-R-13]EUC27046.1 hypothetical protein COCCADRAFT_42101 [Bipolaris zeicola 26-R-13]
MHANIFRLLGANIVNSFMRSGEERHPWQVSETQKLDFSFLRTWDFKSGSNANRDKRMLSRSPKSPLITEQARRDFLGIHLDHRIWVPTPYISFTKSVRAIEDIAKWRSIRRGDQTLTVIGPATRLGNSLPILDITAEMKHYNKGMEHYIDHYVCLREVTAEKIVSHYNWEELVKTKDWFDDIITPAFHKLSKGKRSKSISTCLSAFDMHDYGKSCYHAHIYSHIECLKDSDNSSEHHYLNDDNGTDSDDHTEEANQNDDMIKAMEALW